MIVASNSLTVSNVNDGTIVHTAYAWSADGTDRFMTVYPGENLWSGTKKATIYDSGWEASTNDDGFVVRSRVGAWGSHVPDVKNLKDGDVYTFSVMAKLEADSGTLPTNPIISFINYQSIGFQAIPVKEGEWTWIHYTLTFDKLGSNNARFESPYATARLSKYAYKVEKGPIATPWTPSPLDDPEGAYPTFIGTYTDYLSEDSTDPSKYTWAKLRGEQGLKGADGQSVWSYPYDRGANRLGSYWSDLKPTPTTDNPPKVGDTVIDMIGNMYQITNVVVGGGGGGGTFDYGSLITNIKGSDGKDGIAGKDGVGVKATAITYAQSTSGTTPPTTGWTAGVPTLIKGQYLWTKTVWTYTDSSTETGYTVSYNAKDGNTGSDGRAGKDGTGIKSTVIEYVGAVSGTSKPVNGWSATIPTVPAGQYLWTRTTWQYTDGTSEQGFTNALMGRTGATGADGVAGKDGLGIKSTIITYAVSASGTSAPTSGWVSTPPSATAGQFVWTRTIWTYTDNTTETGYSVGKIGEKGATGANGAPGKPGADGRTPYFHQAWADSKDGKTNFSTTDPTNRGYLGTYTDYTQADSTDPTKYFWVELVGALSIGGRNYLADTGTAWQIQGSGGVNQSSAMKWLFTFGTIKQAPFKDGEYVTVSFDYISTGTGTYGTILSQFNEAPWGQFKGAGDAMKDNGHVVYTVQWKSGWTSGTATGIQIRLDNVATTRTVTVYNMQFERGNKATDHKAAPEDTQGQIDKVNNGLEHVEGLYNSILTPIASVTTPTNPKTGQQWWVLDTNGKTVGLKIWGGSTWTDATIQQSAMNIGTLNGNIINGATINSSNFNVAFDETKENTGRLIGPYFKGTQVIKNGSYLSDYQYKGTTQTGYTHITPEGLTTLINDGNGKPMSRAYLGLGVLELSEQSSTGLITGTINAQDSYRNSGVPIYLNGWASWNEGFKVRIARNGRQVTISGYIKHNGSETISPMLQLPAWACPAQNEIVNATSFDARVFNNTACNLSLKLDGRLVNNAGTQKGGYLSFSSSYTGVDIK